MTKSTEDKKPKPDAEEKAERIRVSPDSPLGYAEPGEEEDFYAKQRRESPDGMTPAEREQHQKAAPGSLGQTGIDGDKLGDPEAEQPKATAQSKG